VEHGVKIPQLQVLLSENNVSDLSQFSQAKGFLSNGKNCGKVRSLWSEVETLLHAECTALIRLNAENLHQRRVCQTTRILCAAAFPFSLHLSLSPRLWWGRAVPVRMCVCASLYTYVRLSLACHHKRLGKIFLPTELKIK